MKPCGLFGQYQRFRETCYLRLLSIIETHSGPSVSVTYLPDYMVSHIRMLTFFIVYSVFKFIISRG